MIDEEATYKRFGYYPSELKPQSHKKILAACDRCGKVRITSKHGYRALCHPCSIRGRQHTAETKRKMSEALMGNKRHLDRQHTAESKQKMSEARKHRKFPQHHTKPELIFEAICKKHNLPFKYTGDNSFWIGKNPAINPDFIHLTKKIVVEIFSYHHNELQRHCKVRYSQTYEGRKKILRKYGYKMIVFWQDDLERKDAEKFVLHTLREEGIIK